jgi:phage baseplate assembly protein W
MQSMLQWTRRHCLPLAVCENIDGKIRQSTGRASLAVHESRVYLLLKTTTSSIDGQTLILVLPISGNMSASGNPNVSVADKI